MKIVGVLCVCLAIILFGVKRLFLTQKGGVMKAVRLSPAMDFWQNTFPMNEIAVVVLILGFVFLVL